MFHYFTFTVFLLLFSYQSFKELPKVFDHRLREEALLSLGTDIESGDEETERQGQRTGNIEVQKSLPQRLVLRVRETVSSAEQ